MSKPDFLIIGAQKSGTTSLFNYLNEHPRIIMTALKEIHFFDLNFDKGFNWYNEFFKDKETNWYNKFFKDKSSSSNIKGEATPYYLFHPCVPERVFTYLPGVKMIVMLRNPADRAYAQYFHEIRIKSETNSEFLEAIALEEKRLENAEIQLLNGTVSYHFSHQHHSYIARSLYTNQIERWLSYFPKSQFLFIKSESFFSNPKEQLKKVYEFLDIQVIYPDKISVFNENHYPPMSEDVRQKLHQLFSDELIKIRHLLGEEFVWE